MKPPLPLAEAQARLLALAEPLPIEHVDIAGALGRYLAEPLLARRTQPGFDLSAMDGYAVAPGDMAGPWRVVGESAAGHPAAHGLAPGEAIQISTGAVMPDGAGAVILQEDLRRTGDRLELTGDPPSPEGKHIRRRGMDFAAGQEVLPAGTRIGPAQLALGIAAGHNHLSARRLPGLAIIDSGDELAADGANCPPHQIPASNGPMLAAMASSLPCRIMRLGPVRDDLEALGQALDAAAAADVIVTSGGASVGDHDLIRPALEAWGAELDFWRIAIKPGKPLLVARKDKRIVLGLPGNPVSSHVTAFLFLLPLIRALAGADRTLPRTFAARLDAPLKAGGARQEFIRAHWDGRAVSPHRSQDSAGLAALAASNALIERPIDAPAAMPGDEVPVYLLQTGGIA
ncbi:MAG: molybdopterin molybdotransferase MoeA [Novosphingobium sp.]